MIDVMKKMQVRILNVRIEETSFLIELQYLLNTILIFGEIFLQEQKNLTRH
jgi:hypothetical protein